MRILLRTACGCERIVNEQYSTEGKPDRDIVVPCMARAPDIFRKARPLEPDIRVHDRRFRLTDQTWVGPGEELFVYEEVL